jgi:hypothetical protein
MRCKADIVVDEVASRVRPVSGVSHARHPIPTDPRHRMGNARAALTITLGGNSFFRTYSHTSRGLPNMPAVRSRRRSQAGGGFLLRFT